MYKYVIPGKSGIQYFAFKQTVGVASSRDTQCVLIYDFFLTSLLTIISLSPARVRGHHKNLVIPEILNRESSLLICHCELSETRRGNLSLVFSFNSLLL